MRLRTGSSSTGTETMRALTTGLGYFSLGLGIVELLAPRPLARGIGADGQTGLVRLCGLREIAVGLGILANRDNPAPWIWARVGGDMLDLMALACAPSHRKRAERPPLWNAALASVVIIGTIDLSFAKLLAKENRIPHRAVDYRSRSGLPKPPEDMRGTARALNETVH